MKTVESTVASAFRTDSGGGLGLECMRASRHSCLDTIAGRPAEANVKAGAGRHPPPYQFLLFAAVCCIRDVGDGGTHVV